VRIAAIAIEVLRGRATVALRSLPQVPQVGVDVAGAIARVLQRVGQCPCAAGAVAGQGLAVAVARPHQADHSQMWLLPSNITLSPDDNDKWYLFCPAKPSYKMGVRLLAKTDP
jgi:hypothetical protein